MTSTETLIQNTIKHLQYYSKEGLEIRNFFQNRYGLEKSDYYKNLSSLYIDETDLWRGLEHLNKDCFSGRILPRIELDRDILEDYIRLDELGARQRNLTRTSKLQSKYDRIYTDHKRAWLFENPDNSEKDYSTLFDLQ